MKTKIAQLETELLDRKTQYEKDQILWDQKSKFIEQQRDNYKKELNETNKRTETMLENIKKKNDSEIEKLTTANQNNLANVEQRYQKQIKDIQEQNEKVVSELFNGNKEKENELKQLRLLLNNNKNKKVESNVDTNKINDLMKENNLLKEQKEQIKKDNEKKISELNSNFDKERERDKNKIIEIEKNLKEAEGKRSVLLLELEKEKAKWNIEKDNLTSKYSDLNEKISTLERKNENLLRENEKLKNERNLLKKKNINSSFMYGSSLMGTTSGQGSGRVFNSNYQSQMMSALGEAFNSEKKLGGNSSNTSMKNINEKK